MFVRYALAAARGLLLPFRGGFPHPAGLDERHNDSEENADSGTMAAVLALVLLAWVFVN